MVGTTPSGRRPDIWIAESVEQSRTHDGPKCKALCFATAPAFQLGLVIYSKTAGRRPAVLCFKKLKLLVSSGLNNGAKATLVIFASVQQCSIP